jgi:predicted kinase
MAHVHLIVGPVGAGKSTFALELCARYRAVRLNLDEWMAELFSLDRPEADNVRWYVERTARCIELIWKLTERIIDAGSDVVLEIGLIHRHDRERLYARIDARAYDLTVYVLDAPREARRQRVAQRNVERGETFSMAVPPHIFELASDEWEPPDQQECDDREVRFISAGAWPGPRQT